MIRFTKIAVIAAFLLPGLAFSQKDDLSRTFLMLDGPFIITSPYEAGFRSTWFDLNHGEFIEDGERELFTPGVHVSVVFLEMDNGYAASALVRFNDGVTAAYSGLTTHWIQTMGSSIADGKEMGSALAHALYNYMSSLAAWGF